MICTVMERMAWCGVISRLSSRRHAWDACTVAASGLTAVQMAVAIRQAVRQTVGLSRLQKKKKVLACTSTPRHRLMFSAQTCDRWRLPGPDYAGLARDPGPPYAQWYL